MRAEIGFYVHHQGSGHLMRCIRLSQELAGYQVTFLGSQLQDFGSIIPREIRCITLPMDFSADRLQRVDDTPTPFLHYAPTGNLGILERNHQLVSYFLERKPVLFIVDVSVEAALLARLCSISVWYMRQHGTRSDAAHQLAYQLAERLLAPYPRWMEDPSASAYMVEKTHYLGAFSRYDSIEAEEKQVQKKLVVILLGSGGTGINKSWVNRVARQCPGFSFRVVGLAGESPQEDGGENVHGLGHLPDPLAHLREADIILGHAGDGTVMEMAFLRKRFVCLPAHRAYDEQLSKAAILERAGLALVVWEWESPHIDWFTVLTEAQQWPTHRWESLLQDRSISQLPQWLAHAAMPFKWS